MTITRSWIGLTVVAGVLGCREPTPRAGGPPPRVVLRATGAVPADLLASRRVAERWIGLWEALATIAEATPGACDRIGAAWATHLDREVGLAALMAASSAEPDAMRRRMASRYRTRMDALVPRVDAIRAACAGNQTIEVALARLEPTAGSAPAAQLAPVAANGVDPASPADRDHTH